MPYVADNFYGNSYVQPSDPAITATTPAVSFVPVGMEDALLVELLRQQIEYYFSEENLEKDFYLRRKMDSEGYLPIKLIASFQRVQNMTHDYNIVISAILSSQTLQVKEDMTCVRTMITPTKWPIADTLYLAVSTSSDFPCPVSSQVPSSVPNGVVLSEPRSIQAV
jgi:la-related protein 1